MPAFFLVYRRTTSKAFDWEQDVRELGSVGLVASLCFISPQHEELLVYIHIHIYIHIYTYIYIDMETYIF